VKSTIYVAVVTKAWQLSQRPEGEWASFLNKNKKDAIAEAMKARTKWEAKGQGPYEIWVGTLTQQVNVPTKFELVAIKEAKPEEKPLIRSHADAYRAHADAYRAHAADCVTCKRVDLGLGHPRLHTRCMKGRVLVMRSERVRLCGLYPANAWAHTRTTPYSDTMFQSRD